MAENLRDAFSRGITVVTDYSGFGSPELALHSLADAMGFHDDALLFWRASDLLSSRRKMLQANSDGFRPQHIFGDILRQRLSSATHRAMKAVHSSCEKRFNTLVASGVAAEKASEEVGQGFMTQLHSIMKAVVFNLNARVYCYKCQDRCPVHAQAAPLVQPDRVRVAIAGTTCTSWSSMGRHG